LEWEIWTLRRGVEAPGMLHWHTTLTPAVGH
jgi:hypothetical protein